MAKRVAKTGYARVNGGAEEAAALPERDYAAFSEGAAFGEGAPAEPAGATRENDKSPEGVTKP
ncbi:MAG: hypothetical protein WA736_16160, partial [Candidatus Acidiferrum sp.]